MSILTFYIIGWNMSTARLAWLAQWQTHESKLRVFADVAVFVVNLRRADPAGIWLLPRELI
jgi:hypothetical protein